MGAADTIVNIPAFADGVARPLEHGWIAVERASGFILVGVLAPIAASAIAIGFACGGIAERTWIAGEVVVALCCGLGVLASSLWPRWEYPRAGYRILPDRIEAWRGLVWRQTLSIPCSRVQYTDVIQGPLQRRHGIATLVVHTAGTHGAELKLPGLSPGLATDVRDWLVGQAGADAV